MKDNPYVGPRPFEDYENLYGRKQEKRKLQNLLIARRIVLLYSPSGAGKTSLIQAALLPALWEEEFLVLPIIRVGRRLESEPEQQFPSGINPYVLSTLLSLEEKKRFALTDQSFEALHNEQIPEELVNALKPLKWREFDREDIFLEAIENRIGKEQLSKYQTLISNHARKNSEFKKSEGELAKMDLAAYMSLDQRFKGTNEPKEVLMVFDQFEEILTVNPFDHDAKKEFFTQLGKALKHGNRWAIFSMREEFVAGLDPYLHLLPTRLRTRFRLELLKEDAASKAIHGPAQDHPTTPIPFTSEAVTQLMADLNQVWVQGVEGNREKQPGLYIEPVQLQVVCHQLWENLPQDVKQIEKTHIKAYANVDTALSRYYTTQIKKAMSSDYHVNEWDIREWFEHHLITEHGFRGQVLKGESRSQGLDNEVIDFFVQAHLVRAEKRLNSTWFELAHDRLIEPVRKNNARWFRRNEDKIDKMAEAFYGRLNESEQGLAQKILTRLVRVREEVAYYTRQSLPINTLKTELGEEICPLLGRLERERLLSRKKGVEVGEEDEVELATKAIIRRWSRFQEWLEKDKQSQRNHYKIRQAAREWRWHNNEESFLMRGSQLTSTEEILAQNHIELSDFEREYVDACIKFREQEETKKERRINILRGLVAGLAIVLLFAVVAAGVAVNRASVAYKAKSVAYKAERIAKSGQLATLAQQAFSDSPPRSLLLAIESAKAAEDEEERRASLAAETLREILAKTGGKRLKGHSKAVNTVAISPENRWLVSWGADKTIKLWNFADAERTKTVASSPDLISGITQSIFSPDRRWLITKHDDGTLQSWDLNSPAPLDTGTQLFVQEKELDVFTVNSARSHVFIGKSDGTVHIRKLTEQPSSTSNTIPDLSGESRVLVVTLSSDGHRLVSGHQDGTASVWDLTRQNFTEPLTVLPGHEWGVSLAVISSDARWVVTGDGDQIVRLWDLKSPNPNETVTILFGHTSSVLAAAFSQDNQWLVTGSEDKTARLWSLNASNPGVVTTVLQGHEDAVGAVGFSADDRWVVTGSDDHSIRLWDVHNMSIALNPGDKGTVAISRDGGSMVTVIPKLSRAHFNSRDDRRSWHRVVQVRDLQSFDRAEHILQRHIADGEESASAERIAISPDGNLLAVPDHGHNILLWRYDALTSRGRPSTLRTEEDAQKILTIAIQEENRWLAAGSRDGKIRIWDLAQTESAAPVTWTAHENLAVERVIIASGGQRIISKDEHDNITIWDSKKFGKGQFSPPDIYARVPEPEEKHGITAIIANGSRVVTGSQNGLVQIWDLEHVKAGQELPLLAEFPGHKGKILAASLSADSHWLLTGSENGVARLWDVRTVSENPLENSTVFRWDKGPVEAVGFHQEREQVITGNRSGHFRLWDLKIDKVTKRGCDIAGRNLSPEEWGKYFRGKEEHRTICSQYE